MSKLGVRAKLANQCSDFLGDISTVVMKISVAMCL